MKDMRENFSGIKRSLALFIKHEALVVLTKSVDSDSDRVEVHLLDVPTAESFSAMESTVQHLMDEFGDLPWLVFAHGNNASRQVRQRFANRAERLVPRSWWRKELHEILVSCWHSVLVTPSAWRTQAATSPVSRNRLVSRSLAAAEWIKEPSVSVVFSAHDLQTTSFAFTDLPFLFESDTVAPLLAARSEVPIREIGQIYGAAA